jgi:hypothetical protein
MRELSDPLTEEDKEWLKSWNREDEIPEDQRDSDDDDEDDEDTDDGGDGRYSSMTKAELVNEVMRRNNEYAEDYQMSTSGNKAELRQRLEDDDASDDA